MKKNDFMQIKGLDIKELTLKAKGFREEIANLVMDKNMKKLKDVKSVSKKRKDLAQVLTVIRQKELLAVLGGQLSGESKSAPIAVAEDKTTKKVKKVVSKTGGKK